MAIYTQSGSGPLPDSDLDRSAGSSLWLPICPPPWPVPGKAQRNGGMTKERQKKPRLTPLPPRLGKRGRERNCKRTPRRLRWSSMLHCAPTLRRYIHLDAPAPSQTPGSDTQRIIRDNIHAATASPPSPGTDSALLEYLFIAWLGLRWGRPTKGVENGASGESLISKAERVQGIPQTRV